MVRSSWERPDRGAPAHQVPEGRQVHNVRSLPLLVRKISQAERNLCVFGVWWPARGGGQVVQQQCRAAAAATAGLGADAQACGAADLPTSTVRSVTRRRPAAPRPCVPGGQAAPAHRPHPGAAPDLGPSCRCPRSVPPGTAPARRGRAGRTAARRARRWTPRPALDHVRALAASVTAARSAGWCWRGCPRDHAGGRWVARIRCRPSDRPRCAMPTSPVTKSGRSRQRGELVDHDHSRASGPAGRPRAARVSRSSRAV